MGRPVAAGSRGGRQLGKGHHLEDLHLAVGPDKLHVQVPNPLGRLGSPNRPTG